MFQFVQYLIRIVLLSVSVRFDRRDLSTTSEDSVWKGVEWESERQFQEEAEEAMWLHYLEEQAVLQAEMSIPDDTWEEHVQLYHTGE